MKIFTSFLLYPILIANLFCQQGSTKFSFTLSGGVTYNLEKAIFKKDLVGDNSLKFSYIDIKLYYNLSRKNSVGLSIGRNLFALPKNFKSGFSYGPLINPPETTFYYIDGHYLESFWWISSCYKFKLNDKWNLSSDIGYLFNTVNNFNKYFSISTGYTFYYSKYFLTFDLSYSFIFRNLNKIMNSKQITLKSSIGVNFNKY